MDGVRTVAGIFLIIGWILLVIGGLVGLGVLFTIRSFAGLVGAMVPLGMALGASLSPFFLWAVLRALIEIYDLQRAALEGGGVTAGRIAPTPSSPGQPPYRPPSPSAPPSVAPPGAFDYCPECGSQNPVGRTACLRCRAAM